MLNFKTWQISLTTPQGWFAIGKLKLITINHCNKFYVSFFIRNIDINGNAKYRKWGGLWWLGTTQCHLQCQHSIERLHFLFNFNRTLCLYCIFFEIWRVICRKSPIFTYPTWICPPPFRVTLFEFHQDLNHEKSRFSGLYYVVLFTLSYV